MTGILHPLIRILADGQFHSGSELGDKLGVSRAAIWKNIKKVDGLGIEVHSVRGKGYKMVHPVTLLDSNSIRAALPAKLNEALHHLEILDTIDSTNSYAMRLLQNGTLLPLVGKYSAVLAEQQTSGKGRRGRQWVSPFGHNICLTMVRQIDTGTMGTEGISLVVGLAIIRALKQQGLTGLGVKWPNDVIVDGKKLAGILLEITGDISGICQLLIGVGININCPPETMEGVDQPWTDLFQVTEGKVDRNLLVSGVISHIMSALDEFQSRGLSNFNAEWRDHDVMIDKQVELITTGKSKFGIARGISGTGALLLETEQGVQFVNGGEVSLRRRSVK
jgi:BirA family transcriptional regulator, biotin operon repressor / biotin---[acetyl-CoA-carboxylase] ligase